MEHDKSVRNMWYVFGYNFLTKINKDWNTALQPSRLRKKTFIYDHITVSDEAMTCWFLKLFQPKIKDQKDKGWPTTSRSYGEGEQELKVGQKDYVAIYQKILEGKMIDGGDLACRWNDIFWEEMVANHPALFDEDVIEMDSHHYTESFASNQEIVILPDPDDENIFFDLSNRRKSSNALLQSNDVAHFDITHSSHFKDIDQVRKDIIQEMIENPLPDTEAPDIELESQGIQAHPI